MGSLHLGWAALVLLLASGRVSDPALAQPPGGAGQPPSGTDRSRPYVPPARPALWTPEPGPWRVLERERIRPPEGRDWLIESGQRRLGNLSGERTVVEVDLPRIVFGRIEGPETTMIAVLLPDGNRDLILRPPDDPEIAAVPSEPTEDAYGRWPNPCSFAILDASGPLDLDNDGTPEVAIHRLCSCASIPCDGIILVELDVPVPHLLDIPSIIGNVDVGAITIRRIDGKTDAARPILEIAPDLLDGCRFIGMAGVRGASECADCCRFPVLARPILDGYELFYDSTVQKELLTQARKDLGYVAAGGSAPLRSVEEAQIARAASFYYLTGLGERTRGLLIEELGPRGREIRVGELLGRLEEIFLQGAPGRR